MKQISFIILTVACSTIATGAFTQTRPSLVKKDQMYMDIHHIGAGKLNSESVAAAHKKDLTEQKKHGVHFIKYWVDTTNGDIYCLSTAPTPEAVRATHAAAHGLLPDEIYQVTDGKAATVKNGWPFFLDVHELGAGNVTAAAVAAAHEKDLAEQKKHGVHFINYWVSEKEGKVFCLSQAANSDLVINTHKAAHGLLPSYILPVKQGQ